jgi:phosphomevalonate kinase
VVLAGEYSVLLPGQPCLVAAVDRTLTATAVAADRWSAMAGAASWVEGAAAPEELKFVAAAIDAVRARWPGPAKRIETRDGLSAGEAKLGLGGSAAATVAAVFAAAEGRGAALAELWELADEVHRAAQGGRGSGADVAASVHGGVVRYWSQPRAARAVAVHPEVRLLLAWTGASVKTAPRLERWKSFLRGEPDAASGFAERSAEAVAALEKALVAGELDAIRGAMGAARAALKGLEAGMGLELETPALKAAADVAWAAGAAGKLSGAGGGDCAVIVCVGEAQRRRVQGAIDRAGLEAIPVGIAPAGARMGSGA